MPLNIDWQQILLHLFNFALLFAILYFLLYKPVKDFMDKRTKYYKDIEDKANENLAESEKAKAKYTEKLAVAEEEIMHNKETAQKELEASLNDKKNQAKAEAEKIISDAKNKAQLEREKILNEAQGEIADMVTTAIEKIVSGENSSDAFDQFLSVAQRGEKDD